MYKMSILKIKRRYSPENISNNPTLSSCMKLALPIKYGSER